VLAADVEMIDIDGTHWANWFGLLVPPAVLSAPRWALLFVDASDPAKPRLVKAIDAGRGNLDPARVPFTGLGTAALGRLREELGVSAVVAIDVDAVPRICAEVEKHLSIDDDYVAQGLHVLRALKRWSGKGLWTEPHLIDLLPAPPAEALQRTFDLLVPDRSSLLAYVVEDDGSRLHASIIATKRKGQIDLVTTHLALADAIPERVLAQDWRTAYKRVLKTVADRMEKPSIGLFLERATFYRILTGPTDQLGRELNARNVIIDPAPAWLLGLLGGATVAAIAGRGARALAGMLPSSARKMASGLAQSASAAIRDSGAHPFSLLGFDPIELWMSVRHFYRQR
jgi:hypothetical protein